mgnify:CR=1 FL=1
MWVVVELVGDLLQDRPLVKRPGSEPPLGGVRQVACFDSRVEHVGDAGRQRDETRHRDGHQRQVRRQQQGRQRAEPEQGLVDTSEPQGDEIGPQGQSTSPASVSAMDPSSSAYLRSAIRSSIS